MERGLLWLPLLAVFVWLAWAGWNEYQKLEAYKSWAKSFERSKYDVFAALGQTGSRLTWGKPTRKGPVDLDELSLETVSTLSLQADGRPVDPTQPFARSRRSSILLMLKDGHSKEIPFTDLEIAIQWFNYLCQAVQTVRSASSQ